MFTSGNWVKSNQAKDRLCAAVGTRIVWPPIRLLSGARLDYLEFFRMWFYEVRFGHILTGKPASAPRAGPVLGPHRRIVARRQMPRGCFSCSTGSRTRDSGGVCGLPRLTASTR